MDGVASLPGRTNNRRDTGKEYLNERRRTATRLLILKIP